MRKETIAKFAINSIFVSWIWYVKGFFFTHWKLKLIWTPNGKSARAWYNGSPFMAQWEINIKMARYLSIWWMLHNIRNFCYSAFKGRVKTIIREWNNWWRIIVTTRNGLEGVKHIFSYLFMNCRDRVTVILIINSQNLWLLR